MANAMTLEPGAAERFRSGSTAIRVVNPSESERASLELSFGSGSGQGVRLQVPPGGSLTQPNAGQVSFRAVNRGSGPLQVQPIYNVEIFVDDTPADRLANLWFVLDAGGFQVTRHRAAGRALPDTPSVIYAPDPEGDQLPVALRLREIMKSQGVSNIALVDAESLHVELDEGNFILLPSDATYPLRALSCIQVYDERERTMMALVNGVGWIEYGPASTRVIVTDACVINPPQPGHAYFIASFDGKGVAQFNHMSFQRELLDNTYVFTNLSR